MPYDRYYADSDSLGLLHKQMPRRARLGHVQVVTMGRVLYPRALRQRPLIIQKSRTPYRVLLFLNRHFIPSLLCLRQIVQVPEADRGLSQRLRRRILVVAGMNTVAFDGRCIPSRLRCSALKYPGNLASRAWRDGRLGHLGATLF